MNSTVNGVTLCKYCIIIIHCFVNIHVYVVIYHDNHRDENVYKTLTFSKFSNTSTFLPTLTIIAMQKNNYTLIDHVCVCAFRYVEILI